MDNTAEELTREYIEGLPIRGEEGAEDWAKEAPEGG